MESKMGETKVYQYQFSVIIPVYNVEEYLEETIQSVVDQSIGFRKNIQMILVNDGSPDNSEEICKKYEARYPDNVVYVKQENAGVSAARNKGMEYVKGEFVNFLDSDDKWSKNAFQDVAAFFEKHGDDIDIVAGRIKYFEKKTDYHTLDYKFEEDKVVDILEDYTYIQLSMATTFIRATALQGRVFDSRIRYGEDCILINTILLDKCKYGVLRDSVYFYRMRNVGTSAMQNTVKTRSFYMETEELVFKRLLDMSEEKFGRVIEYIQYLVMYDTKWRLRAPIPAGVLTEEEEEHYKKGLVEILRRIDDHIIVEQKNCTSLQFKMALDMKYQTDIARDVTYEKGLIRYKNLRLTHIARRRLLFIDFIEFTEDSMNITGQADYWLSPEDYKIAFEDQNHQRHYVEFFDMPHKNKYGVNGCYGGVRAYRVSIPLENLSRIKPVFVFRQEEGCSPLVYYGKFTGLTHWMESSYTVQGKYLLKRKGKSLTIQKLTKRRYHYSEKQYCKELRKLREFRMLFYRYALRLFKKFHKKKVWLLSDRINIARDNGEALFHYLNTVDTGDVVPYFTISRKSDDYKRLKKTGKVIPHGSFWYKLHFLAADKIISAHIDEYVINAFDGKREYLKNLYQFDFVFLQHGLTKDDLSGWLNKFNKDIKLFVTGAKPEYDSIIQGDYYYTDKQVKLTGFPRFDHLVKEKTKKQLIILPTWRKELANAIDPKTGERVYNREFKNTPYFQFYSRLIQDERLLACMREHGYQGKFCLHVNHMEQIGDFQGNDIIEIQQGNLDYQKEFLENALMVTDYSSVAFDFAYMKKSLVYAQFDRQEFFAGQVYDEGYFDYERDGFGPVCYQYEDTVQKIIDAIERDCQMEEIYEKRVDSFYYKTDSNNCKRVYEAICQM